MEILMLAPFLVLLLFGGHAIADFGQQSAHVAEYKVRVIRRPGPDGAVVETPNPDWFVTLAAHCLIHAFVVGTISFGFLMLAGIAGPVIALVAAVLGWLEFIIHFVIDDAKGRNRFSYRVDQALHYACKLVWTAVLIACASAV